MVFGQQNLMFEEELEQIEQSDLTSQVPIEMRGLYVVKVVV